MQKASGQKWKAEWRVLERKIKEVKDIESYIKLYTATNLEIVKKTKMDRKMLEACRGGYVYTVKRLITDRSVNVNVNLHPATGSTPLYVTCANRSTEVVRYLLTIPDCQVTCVHELRGHTPLHSVCSWGRYDHIIVGLLLAREDCDPNVKDIKGNTPLILAIKNHNKEIVNMPLRSPKCDPTIANLQGETPLHVACRKGAIIVKMLLKSGKCDSNVQTNAGDTPLHLATRMENTEIIKILLADPQCDPNETNNQGETPLQIALKLNNSGFIILIIERGCHETYANRDQMLTEASSLIQRATDGSLPHLACESGSTTVPQFSYSLVTHSVIPM